MLKAIQINIDEPCHENWQNMTPNEQGRFCGSCQKTVVDFSTMTDKEILDHISKASTNICGRVANDQMNRDIKAPQKKKSYKLVYVWNLLLASFLLAKADAQNKIVRVKTPTVVKAPERVLVGMVAMREPVLVKGVVVDASNGQPVAGASIRIRENEKGVMADTAGVFKLTIDKPVEVEVTAIGYEKQTVVLEQWQNADIRMKRDVMGLTEVLVQGYPTVGKISLMGAMSTVRKVSIPEKIKRNVCEWLPKKDVKVFPNPAIRGNNIQVSLVLPQPGNYKLELMDAAGKVIMVQTVQAAQTPVSIETNKRWSAGVYWVRITGKKVYTSKLVLQ